mgnify:CR=1 FL=1
MYDVMDDFLYTSSFLSSRVKCFSRNYTKKTRGENFRDFSNCDTFINISIYYKFLLLFSKFCRNWNVCKSILIWSSNRIHLFNFTYKFYLYVFSINWINYKSPRKINIIGEIKCHLHFSGYYLYWWLQGYQ